MNINKDLLEKKYKEMKSANIDEDFLDEKLRGIKVFLNKKPSSILFKLRIEPDDVYIGSN